MDVDWRREQKRLSDNKELHPKKPDSVRMGINSQTAVDGGIETRNFKTQRPMEKLILGGRIKTVEENHWPKNKVWENLRTGATLTDSTEIGLSEKQESDRLPSDENLTVKKRKGDEEIQHR
jgi:hypothetical protein